MKRETLARIVVVHNKPADPEAFDRHYFDIHVPLAKKLPGIRRFDVSKGPVDILSSGEAPYMVATLHFDSVADIRRALPA